MIIYIWHPDLNSVYCRERQSHASLSFLLQAKGRFTYITEYIELTRHDRLIYFWGAPSENTQRWPIVGLLLVQRRRLRANIKAESLHCVVFPELLPKKT